MTITHRASGQVERSAPPMDPSSSTTRRHGSLEALAALSRGVRCGCSRCGARTYAARQLTRMSRVCSVCGGDVAPLEPAAATLGRSGAKETAGFRRRPASCGRRPSQ